MFRTNQLKNDLEFSNKYKKEIMNTLQNVFNQICPCIITDEIEKYKDLKENADYVIDFLGERCNLAVACRIRRIQTDEYFNNITMRSKVPSGKETEWDKFQNSCGDIMFYGIENKEGNGLEFIRIINLKIFRRLIFEYRAFKGREFGAERDNKDKNGNYDGTSFRYFDLRYFPRKIGEHELIIYESGSKKIPYNDVTYDIWKDKLKNNIYMTKPEQDIPGIQKWVTA